MVHSPKLVLTNTTDMKVLKSSPISSFGGLNFVIKEFDNKGLSKLLNDFLPTMPKQSTYCWRDLMYSFWSVFFCGGDCCEDLNGNFKSSFSGNPLLNIPSSDRVLNRMHQLAEPVQLFDSVRGNVKHEFNFNKNLNALNLAVLKNLLLLKKDDLTLDYDNTLIFTKKADAKKTYKSERGYAPGVGLIGSNVVYIENRNGNSDAQTLQQDTLTRMFQALNDAKIKARRFRADSASYQLLTLSVASDHTEFLYVRARRDPSVMKAIASIKHWQETATKGVYRGTVDFVPFKKRAREHHLGHLLQTYRLVVTKEPKANGQLNMFTNEACHYHAIITNDWEMTNDEIVNFYNKRGAAEKEFDILKNDFGWNNLPFSKLESNTVFLILTALCRNLYDYIIRAFSARCKHLASNYRIKKFIFRFICVPAKWIRNAREYKLKIYGDLGFVT